MKLINAEQEIQKKKIEVLKNADRYRKIFVFGAGILGAELLETLQEYEMLQGYVDNNIEKQEKGYLNYNVYSLKEYLSIASNHFLVVAVSNQNRAVVAETLEQNGLHKSDDFCFYDEFLNERFPVISLCLYDKAFVSLAQISLTERCSLKCKKCAHACYAVGNESKDLTLQQVFKSADSFFSKVDYIHEFVLIGGEPLLYRELNTAIAYIGKKYRNKMGIFSITTNGTIIPSESVMEACKKYNILFRVSNYTKQIPRLEEKHIRLRERFLSYKVDFQFNPPEREWMDYGFEYVNRQGEEEELIKVFDGCRTECREIRENRFYYCVMARSVADNLKRKVGEEDYLDLDKLVGDDYKEELLKFSLGYSEKGYLDMCKYCHGGDAKYHPIPAAEQM